MDSIRLTFPAQQQGQHLLVETEPTALKRWLTSLPYGDMARAVPEVCRAIASLNRSKISVTQREELVELFDKTYAQIFNAYRPHAPHIITDDARRKEHNNLHRLTREMAFAHKIIADRQLNKRRFWGKNKHLMRSINLSLHYLGLLLMEHYESYSSIPVYLWRECNSLYAYAQSKHIEDVEIFGNGYFQCLSTIEKTFARTCLMALSDPYHLSDGEHWQMFKYLEKWAFLVEFSDDHTDISKEACFIIQLDSQLRPEYLSQFNREVKEAKHTCFMLSHEMIRQLKYDSELLTNSQEIPAGFYPEIRPGSARSLLEHMSKHWNAKIERQGRRYPILTKLDVIWGIHPIHSLLTQHKLSPEATHWDETAIENFLQNEHKVPLNWEACNVGDGGIGIATHQNIAHKLKVGELVIIREYIDKKPSFRWRPAVCRWLFGDNNQGTKAGLEFLEGTITPCRLHNKMSKSNKSFGQVALMLHSATNKPATQPTLLATRGTYHDGRSFLLRHSTQAEDIKTRTRNLVTPCVEVFSYQVYEVVEVEEPVEKETSDTIPWTSMPSYKDQEEDSEKDSDINFDSIRLPGDH